ncbi:hypothetical protein [Paraburkholderia piptadeniae]|nr:hypothetical protein [Paraburkholderia piptadeniae]
MKIGENTHSAIDAQRVARAAEALKARIYRLFADWAQCKMSF